MEIVKERKIYGFWKGIFRDGDNADSLPNVFTCK